MIENLKYLDLLYIEDNTFVRKEYIKTFNLLFNNIYEASNFNQAMKLYKQMKPNLLIVDIELDKGLDGFEIANEIRREDLDTPIILLTSHNDTNYLLRAINNNINGYIIKPLNLDNLMSVLQKALLDNVKTTFVNISSEIKYNTQTYELLKNNEKVSLGKKEHSLLRILIKNVDRTLRRDELEYEIWNETFISDSALKNLISVLRKKIGKERIINTSKLGWRIVID